jgi:hypothetical protein
MKSENVFMNLKKKALLDRIKRVEEELALGREYLEDGEHADWRGFRPLFANKVRDGKVLPPHKDWVKSVFLPRRERALAYAQKTLEELDCRCEKRVRQLQRDADGTARRQRRAWVAED